VLRSLMRYLLAAGAGYLCGAIPFGFLVGRLYGIDLQQIGSRHTGTANVIRTVGTGPGIAVFALDFLKGATAILLVRRLLAPGRAWAETVSGLAAVVGHNHSVFLRFRGGRGVATGGGALLAVSPPTWVLAAPCWIIPTAISRYTSLGSICSSAAAGLIATAFAVRGRLHWPRAIYALVTGAYIIFAHRDNIQRLLDGTERRLGEKATPPSTGP
jgi:glycerol-3-phosphate acyltransferase PlsY